MKKFTIATTAAAALSTAVLGLATPALAAPSGGGDASQTISQLEAQGHRVIVKKQSSAPLAESNVVSVRPGPPIREYVDKPGRQGDNRNKTDRVLQEVGKVYFVEVR
jgi:hypothetical protein